MSFPQAMVCCGAFMAHLLMVGSAAAATYYVDYATGDDGASGQSADRPWKHAPGDPAAEGNAAKTQLGGGDVVQFRAGVIYRGNIRVSQSGEPGKRISYRGAGWGEGRAIVDGSELLTGWKKCASPADAGGAENFENLFFTEVETDSPFFLNLHEVNPKTGEDEFLLIAQDPAPKDPFFHDRRDGFFPVTRENLTTTSIRSETEFTSSDPQCYDGASVLLWVNPNWTRCIDIESYDPASQTIRFADIGESALYTDGRDQYFSIYNSVHVLDQPGEYAVSRPDASGKRRVVLWPRSPDDLDARISRSVRLQGFYVGEHSHLEIEGFEIRKFAGADNDGGCGIATLSGGSGKRRGDYVFKNNRIYHNQSGAKGHGGIFLDKTDEALVEDNDILWNKNHRAIFATGGSRIIIKNNRVEHAGRTAVVFYTVTESQIIGNRISDILGTHANALTLYVGCENVLVAGNQIMNATNAITFQDSGPLYFINNYTEGADTYRNVNEWPNTKRGPWTYGRIVFLNNTFVSAEKNSSLGIAKDPKKEYVIINNILDGVALGEAVKVGAKVTISHNLYTGLNSFQSSRYGWSLAQGELQEEDPAAVFVAPDRGDFRLRPGGPAVGAGADVSAFYPKDIFPDVDFDSIAGVTKPMNIGASLPLSE